MKIEGGGGGGGKKGSVVHVPTELYNKGCVQNIQDGLKVSVCVWISGSLFSLWTLINDTRPQAAESIGYPVMIKASAGGGGKGIRKARNSDEFPSLFHQVQAEVPGSPVFVMQLARK